MSLPASAPDRRPPASPNVVGALCTGALCGASLVSANFVVINLFGGRPGDGPFLAIFAFPFALIVWSVGLLVVGGPAWVLLHALGLTSRWIGAVVGGAAAALAMAVMLHFHWVDLLDPDHGMAWRYPLADVAIFGAIGAVVGWVVIRLAYGRPELVR